MSTAEGSMAVIVPSILEDTVEAFHEKVESILKIPAVERIQVDVSDGKFTPRTTVHVADIEPLNPAYTWELHLMCENPEEYFLDAKIAGFNTVLFPFEAAAGREQLATLVGKLRSMKIEPGLSVNPQTPVEEIETCLDLFGQVVLLSVEPGYQGQQFIEQTLEKIVKLRHSQKNVTIEVDGGINSSTARRAAQAGADYLVVGSALGEYEKIQAETNTNGEASGPPT